jgi:hypothetical protein
MIEDFCDISGLDLTDYRVFKYEKDVLIVKKELSPLPEGGRRGEGVTPPNLPLSRGGTIPFKEMMDKVYFLRFGKRIGSFE